MKIQKNVLHISASNMREAVTLNTVTRVADGEGGYTTTITPLKTIFANVEMQKGSRTLELAAISFERVYKIYCRYDDLITNNSTLTYKGQQLTIHSIDNLSQLNRYFEILAYTDV